MEYRCELKQLPLLPFLAHQQADAGLQKRAFVKLRLCSYSRNSSHSEKSAGSCTCQLHIAIQRRTYGGRTYRRCHPASAVWRSSSVRAPLPRLQGVSNDKRG